MRVLHIMPFGIFAVNYVNAFNERDKDKHIFWLYGYNKSLEIERNIYFKNNKNVLKFTTDYYENLKRYFTVCEVLVIQCIPENYELLIAIKKCFLEEQKPYVVIPWGRDADRTSDVYRQDESIWKPIDKIKGFLIRNSSYIMSTRRVYESLENNYHANCPRLFFNSLLAFRSDELFACPNREIPDKKIRVLVGHRGTRTSGHLEIFNMIEPYKNNISRVICPLSYGEKEYIKEVKRTGAIKFSDKWEDINQWMPKSEYYEFLNSNVDVGVFLCQLEGASTIFALAYMGKKVYLPENSEVAEILDDIGVVYSKIGSDGIDKSFITMLSEEDATNNMERMKRYGSRDEFYQHWDTLLQACYESGNFGM